MYVCVRAWVRACMRACVCMYVCMYKKSDLEKFYEKLFIPPITNQDTLKQNFS